MDAHFGGCGFWKHLSNDKIHIHNSKYYCRNCDGVRNEYRRKYNQKQSKKFSTKLEFEKFTLSFCYVLEFWCVQRRVLAREILDATIVYYNSRGLLYSVWFIHLKQWAYQVIYTRPKWMANSIWRKTSLVIYFKLHSILKVLHYFSSNCHLRRQRIINNLLYMSHFVSMHLILLTKRENQNLKWVISVSDSIRSVHDWICHWNSSILMRFLCLRNLHSKMLARSHSIYFLS